MGAADPSLTQALFPWLPSASPPLSWETSFLASYKHRKSRFPFTGKLLICSFVFPFLSGPHVSGKLQLPLCGILWPMRRAACAYLMYNERWHGRGISHHSACSKCNQQRKAWAAGYNVLARPHQNYSLSFLRQGRPLSLNGKPSIVKSSVFVFHCTFWLDLWGQN